MRAATSASSSIVQRSSPAKQKYSRPTHALSGSGTIHGDHERIVLDAADAHARLVDVDPVVGEEILAVDDERDGEEVAVAKAARGFEHLLRRRSGCTISTTSRNGSEEMTASGSVYEIAARLDLDDPAAGELEPRHGRVEPNLAALLRDRDGHRVPHLARARSAGS